MSGEDDLSRDLARATERLDRFSFPDEGEDGGAGATNGQPNATLVDDVQHDPSITGPTAPPQREQNGYDLQDQFQDEQGPTLGGDPRDGVPSRQETSRTRQTGRCGIQ